MIWLFVLPKNWVTSLNFPFEDISGWHPYILPNICNGIGNAHRTLQSAGIQYDFSSFFDDIILNALCYPFRYQYRIMDFSIMR